MFDLFSIDGGMPAHNHGGYALLGHNKLVPLNLSEEEVKQLAAFLETISGPAPAVE